MNFSLGSLVGFFRKVIFLSPYSPPPPAKLKNISFWSSCHRAQQYNKGRGTGVDLGGFLFLELSKGQSMITDQWKTYILASTNPAFSYLAISFQRWIRLHIFRILINGLFVLSENGQFMRQRYHLYIWCFCVRKKHEISESENCYLSQEIDHVQVCK